jgi:hypothetical protein
MCELIVLGIVVLLVLMIVCSNLLGQICGCARERNRKAAEDSVTPAAPVTKEGFGMRTWEEYLPTQEGSIRIATDGPTPPAVVTRQATCCGKK